MRGRQANYHRTTISPIEEFAIISTSENPNGNWKPIPYAHYTTEAFPSVRYKLVSAKSEGIGDGGKAAVVNTITNGDSGHIQRVKNSDSDVSSTPHQENLQFDDYALLHYYIPFDQFISHQTPKPIMETVQDIPPKTITIEQLMKAAVEPIPIFRLEPTTMKPTSTAPPSTTAKTEPPTTTTVAVSPPEPVNKKEVSYSRQKVGISYTRNQNFATRLNEIFPNENIPTWLLNL